MYVNTVATQCGLLAYYTLGISQPMTMTVGWDFREVVCCCEHYVAREIHVNLTEFHVSLSDKDGAYNCYTVVGP